MPRVWRLSALEKGPFCRCHVNGVTRDISARFLSDPMACGNPFFSCLRSDSGLSFCCRLGAALNPPSRRCANKRAVISASQVKCAFFLLSFFLSFSIPPSSLSPAPFGNELRDGTRSDNTFFVSPSADRDLALRARMRGEKLMCYLQDKRHVVQNVPWTLEA